MPKSRLTDNGRINANGIFRLIGSSGVVVTVGLLYLLVTSVVSDSMLLNCLIFPVVILGAGPLWVTISTIMRELKELPRFTTVNGEEQIIGTYRLISPPIQNGLSESGKTSTYS